MTTTASGETIARIKFGEVQAFVAFEARLADEHRYDEWESLWTDDGRYLVPAGTADRDPEVSMAFINDNRSRIATRVRQLNTGKRWAQAPPSNLRRVLGIVEILAVDDAGTLAAANFMLVESRPNGSHLWAGRTEYRLRRVDRAVRLAEKKVMLVDADRDIPTLAFLI